MGEEVNVDVIIIGSSPLTITEAIYQKEQGLKVLNIDNRSSFGGAWTTVQYPDFPEIEIGCHIWDIQKETIEFIRKFFALDLVPLSPQPILLRKGRVIPYDWKVNASTTKRIIKRLASLRWKSLLEDFRSPHMRFALKPSKYLYPRQGAKALKEALDTKVLQHNLQFELNTMISEARIADSAVELISDKGQRYVAKKIVITSLSSIKKITFALTDQPEETIVLATRKIDYIHFHIVYRGSKAKKFSYIRWMNDTIIHRVSDMTSQVQDEIPRDWQIISVGVFEKAYYTTENSYLVETITNRLKRQGYLLENAEMIQFDANVFPSYYNDYDKLQELEIKSGGKVRFLPSTNFTYGFYNQLHRYKTIKDRCKAQIE